MATSTIVRNNKRILNTISTSSFSATTNAWTNTGTSLRLPKGKWFIMAEYRITGANADAGINIGWSNTSRETFHPRGYNSSWNHPISITAIAEPTSDTNLTCNYFVQNAGTISYVSLTAIEL